jgi:hypothetical protein
VLFPFNRSFQHAASGACKQHCQCIGLWGISSGRPTPLEIFVESLPQSQFFQSECHSYQALDDIARNQNCLLRTENPLCPIPNIIGKYLVVIGLLGTPRDEC